MQIIVRAFLKTPKARIKPVTTNTNAEMPHRVSERNTERNAGTHARRSDQVRRRIDASAKP